MVCIKCNGLMGPADVYTEGSQPIKAMRCMNCGKYDYAPLELRVIPVKDYKYHERACGNGNRTLRLITCQGPMCGKVSEGYGYKYCSRKCQNAASNRNARELRLRAKELNNYETGGQNG